MHQKSPYMLYENQFHIVLPWQIAIKCAICQLMSSPIYLTHDFYPFNVVMVDSILQLSFVPLKAFWAICSRKTQLMFKSPLRLFYKEQYEHCFHFFGWTTIQCTLTLMNRWIAIHTLASFVEIRYNTAPVITRWFSSLAMFLISINVTLLKKCLCSTYINYVRKFHKIREYLSTWGNLSLNGYIA